MRKYGWITILTSLLLTASLLTGCGLLPVPVRAAEAAETGGTEDMAVEDAAGLPTDLPVTGNGGHFVLQGAEIYFRSYPADALDRSALGGNFLSSPTGGESDMMVYHTQTGDTNWLFSDTGFGRISILDGRFYMEGQETKEDGTVFSYIYSCLSDGSDVRRIPSDHSLFFAGLEEETGTLVLQAYDGEGKISLELWQKDTQTAVLSDPEGDMVLIGAGGGFLVMASGDSLVSCDLEKKETIRLGALPESDSRTGYDSYWDFAMDGLAFSLKAVNVEGSMALPYEGAVLKGRADQADSLEILPAEDISAFEEKPDTDLYARIEEALDGPSLTGEADPAQSFSSEELREDLDQYTCLIINDQVLDPEGSVGWRDAYIRNISYYILADNETEEIILMHEEDCLHPGDDRYLGPLVTDALTRQGTYRDDVGNDYTYCFFIPRFNADTAAAAALNRRILDETKGIVDQEIANMEKGLSLTCGNLTYQAFETEGRASVLICIGYETDDSVFMAASYDFVNDREISNGDLLAMAGLTEEEFSKRARELTEEAFREMYPDAGIGGDALLKENRDRLRADLPMYMDEEGFFHAILPVASMAGASCYYQDFTF